MIFTSITYNYDGEDFVFQHKLTKDDIVEFLWEKSYNFEVQFSSDYYFQPDWKEHYNDAEKLYLENEVDEYALADDPDFKDFCARKYESEIENYLDDAFDQIENDVDDFKEDRINDLMDEEKWV